MYILLHYRNIPHAHWKASLDSHFLVCWSVDSCEAQLSQSTPNRNFNWISLHHDFPRSKPHVIRTTTQLYLHSYYDLFMRLTHSGVIIIHVLGEEVVISLVVSAWAGGEWCCCRGAGAQGRGACGWGVHGSRCRRQAGWVEVALLGQQAAATEAVQQPLHCHHMGPVGRNQVAEQWEPTPENNFKTNTKQIPQARQWKPKCMCTKYVSIYTEKFVMKPINCHGICMMWVASIIITMQSIKLYICSSLQYRGCLFVHL